MKSEERDRLLIQSAVIAEPESHIQKQLNSKPKRILICGHRSFAAQGLVERLQTAGHQVICFSRGEEGEKDDLVTGPVDRIDVNPHLSGAYDTLINYILLKEESAERNLAYLEAVTRFCLAHGVKHLIHISSMSVYPGSRQLITEQTPMETNALQKGNYGALKVISDQFLEQNLPPDTRLSEVRPGFILGPGLTNPIGGIGLQLPGNRLLAIGNDQRQMPLISRDILNEALLRLISDPPVQKKEVLLLTDPQSPLRRGYLEGCCRELGCGEKVFSLPNAVWLGAALFGEIVLTLLGQRKKVFARVKGACDPYRFDSHGTEKRLGLSLTSDWKAQLRRAMAAQEAPTLIPRPPETPSRAISAKTITYVGFGKIVKQKHLPALRKIEFNGVVNAYDLREGIDCGYKIQSIGEAPIADADVIVVATPGPLHAQSIAALQQLQGAILVEKPLANTLEELERWKSLAKGRKAPVIACHNYRYKTNVSQMINHLNRYNPGQLLRVDVDFQSPPVQSTAPAWARDERRTRTLLMDFGIHFLDIACMFDEGPWRVVDVRAEPDRLQQTRLIEGRLAGSLYTVSFLLRQGFGPKSSRLRFTFQNYSAHLGFFPETCVISVVNDWFPVLGQAPVNLLKALAGKLTDRIRRRDSDPSHARVYRIALGEEPAEKTLISVEKLEPFYRMLFDLGDRVYKNDAWENTNV